MPGFVKTPKDEARWAKAKEAAGKSTEKDSESYWKLSNYIYHKMGKTEEDQKMADLAKADLEQHLQKAEPKNPHGIRPVAHHEFHNALHQASLSNPKIKENVEFHPPEKLQHMKTFLSADGRSGYAITPDGELTSVFSSERGRGNALVAHSVAQGAKHLNAFEGHLTNLYANHGFKEHRRENNWTPGGPSVVFMRRSENIHKSEESNTLSTGNLKDLDANIAPVKQSLPSNEVLNVSDEKKYTAKEAAIAVLKKAEELLAKSSLMKGFPSQKHGHAPIGAPQRLIGSGDKSKIPGQKAKSTHDSLDPSSGHRPGQGRSEHSKTMLGTSRAGLNVKSSHGGGKEEAKSAHKETLGKLHAQPKPNLPKSEAGMDKAETGHEKGINTSTDPKQKSRVMMGTSKAGSQLPSTSKLDVAEAKEAHKQVLSEMKRMPKPNLTKDEKGVHAPIPRHIPGKGISHGSSVSKPDEGKDLKPRHKEKLQELRDMPKPNLTKAAPYNIGHREAKGVHGQAGPTHAGENADPRHGVSAAGANVRRQDKIGTGHAKNIHKEKLSELRAMQKPNLTKEEGMRSTSGKNEIGTKFTKEEQQGESKNPGDRVEQQTAPKDNPKEQAEGNNEKAGTTPTQVGQDGKNLPGYDEQKVSMKHSNLKLAKFIGHVQAKRKMKAAPTAPVMDKAETGHEVGVHVQDDSQKPGVSSMGRRIRNEKGMEGAEHAKGQQKFVADQAKNIKPKLPR